MPLPGLTNATHVQDNLLGMDHLFNITSLSCRIVLFILVLLLLSPLPVFAEEKVSVTIEGISDQLYKNVLARLKLYLHRENERLGSREVKRLYRQADGDIRSALAPFGYYKPEIKGELKKENDQWKALFVIVKGDPVLVKEVGINLAGPGKDEETLLAALAKFPLNAGDILDQNLYEEGKKQLINIAFDEGFLEANFAERALRINIETNSAVVNLALQTGPKYLFGETTSDQKILKQKLLDKYLPYRVGDAYNPAKLFELQSILYRTDYFSKVVAKGDTENAVDLHIPVTLELTPPLHRNKYSLGLGYATDTGIRGKIDWTNRLINTKGTTLKASLLVAEYENTLYLSYDIPRGDPRYEKIVHTLAYQDQTWDDTDTRLLTASVRSKYADPRFVYGMGLELRDEVYDVGNTSGDSILLIPSLSGGFIFADNISNTKNGLQASIGFLGAVDGFIADASFLQMTVSGKAIISPFKQWRLLGRGSLGATYVDSINSLPPSLRFYTGGDSSIRGYKYKSIGTEDDSGTVIGGRYLVVSSIELERVFSESWSVAGFWDVGSATDDLKLDFYQGIGGGVRLRLPFGQIRLDLASAITEEGQPFRLHLTVGADL